MNRILTLAVLALCAPVAYSHPHHGDPVRGSNESQPSPPPLDKPYGRAGDSASISRTLSLVMDEGGRCSPGTLAAKQGESVKIVARNASKRPQELAIGTAAELKEHADVLKKFPRMQGSHANRAHAATGATVELVWRFTQPGEFSIACAPSGQFVPEGLAKVTVRP